MEGHRSGGAPAPAKVVNCGLRPSQQQKELIHEIFEEQARRTPHAVAISCQGSTLTYLELNEKANQLAHHLIGMGVGAETLVGLYLERNIEMVIGVLGILKAGGAYLPLDPVYPTGRLAYILDDASPKVLLTQEQLRSKVRSTTAKLLVLDSDWDQIGRCDRNNVDAHRLEFCSSQLAYVIYTSGSTGEPKGVLVEHRNVTRLFTATDPWFGFNERDVWTLFHSIAFDFSVWELWGALFHGGRLVIVPHLTARSPEEFYRLLCEEQVTVLNQTPRAFIQLIGAQRNGHPPVHQLRVVIFGGEALDFHALRPWIERNGAHRPQLVNMYGITETTVHVTYHALSEEDIRSGKGSLIGRPIPDLQVYLLDACGRPVPIGVVGELYVGGEGVARGYLNRAKLTAEQFVPDPFSTRRLYKTGDLGRWHADGTLEYLGRNDTQVKIRGYRIELGEIEAQLTRQPAVSEAVVLAREDTFGQKHLVGYLTVDTRQLKEQARVESQSDDRRIANEPLLRKLQQQLIPRLREALLQVLPPYMVPSAWVILEKMPLTQNGKLAHRELPSPGIEAYTRKEYETPQGRVEETLAEIWQDILGVDQIGRLDNFFELGGHSLLIVQLMDRLRQHGLSTDVRSVFDSPTLADLSATVSARSEEPERAAAAQPPISLIPEHCERIVPEMLPLLELEPTHIDLIARAIPGGQKNIQDIYPLTALQEGILFHHLQDEDSDTYVLLTLLSLASNERLQELIRALQSLINRHEVLRTAVLWDQLPRPVQVVCRQATLVVEAIPLQPDDTLAQLKHWMQPEHQKLDLRRAPLMRLRIASDPVSKRWYALLQLHHLICDNESLELMLAEVGCSLRGGEPPKAHYLPFKAHVAQALSQSKDDAVQAFFRRKLGDVEESTTPFGLLDVRRANTGVKVATRALEPALEQQIWLQARCCGVSAATLFHAAWALVLSLISDRDDVIYGTVLMGRLHGNTEAQRIVGLCINTLPLRLRLQDLTARKLVELTQRELAELLAHEQASLAVAQECSGIAGSGPLFNTLLNYRPHASGAEASLAGTPGLSVLDRRSWTNYPVALSIDRHCESFTLELKTDPKVDPQRLLSYMHTALHSLALALEQAPDTPALTLPILPESERRLLIEHFNATDDPEPSPLLVHELFQRQAQLTPRAIALQCAEQQLTYAELDQRANTLAQLLRAHGVQPDERVVVYVERGLELIVALLGILKAGAAYVPLDVNYPTERLAHVIRDCAPVLLLTQKHLLNGLPPHSAHVMLLDGLKYSLDLARTTASQPSTSSPQHLAYVIYTSGSTGAPKGVMIEHRNLANLIHWHCATFNLRQGSRCSCLAAIGFDAATWEIWPPLCVGGTVVLAAPQLARDPQALLQWWERQDLQVSFLPTPVAELAFARNRYPPTLTTLLVGGDCLRSLPTDATFSLINNYGPTESTVVTTSGSIARTDPVLHIGRPIANTQVYILDRQRRPVPLGVPGEIYIAGANLARGYLNRPELTQERFVEDPFSATPNARMYRSGDLARWRPDGTIEFLGRNDHQVKIRGHRIELGEIEAQLARCPGVKKAIVLARESAPSEKLLIAYLTARDSFTLDPEVLRAQLATVLPQYMVPSAFVVLPTLPLTAHGKLDRRALPAPRLQPATLPEDQAPQGELERLLARIWSELLHREPIARTDNFFSLGGHSLLATRVTTRIRAACALDLPMKALFEYPTLSELAAHLESLIQQQADAEDPASEEDVLELLEQVASMPESAVQNLVRDLEQGGRS
jgi:amino acid adenylation domain-containing protein